MTSHRTIDVLRKLAKDADSIHQGCAASNRTANITGAIGGGLQAIAGGVTFAGDGLAASMVLASLKIFGPTCSIGAGYCCIRNQCKKDKRNEELRKQILDQLAEDEEVLNEIQTNFHRAERGDFGEPSMIFRELHIGVVGLTSDSRVVRIDKLVEAFPAVEFCILSMVNPFLKECLPMLAEKAILIGMENAVKQSAASAVKFMQNGLGKKFVKRHATIAGQKAYEEVFDKVTENAAVQAANKVAKKGGDIVRQHTARETAKKAATEAAKEKATKAARGAAKEAADESGKTLVKMTGSWSVVFGVLTSMWEGYNAYQNHCEMKKDSQLGRELRDLADRLEND